MTPKYFDFGDYVWYALKEIFTDSEVLEGVRARAEPLPEDLVVGGILNSIVVSYSEESHNITNTNAGIPNATNDQVSVVGGMPSR